MKILNNKQNFKKGEILANKDEKMSDRSIKRKTKTENELEKETRKNKRKS